MAEAGVRPLSDSLGLPDIFPHDADCAEDRLTPEVLLHGYRHSEAAAVGLTPQRELALTLTDQPAAFYGSASLAYWRRSLRQQLQGPARLLASKRKAHELFDVPLGIAVRAAGPAGGGSAALPPSQPRQLPAPGFPQQSSRGPAGREAAEAWARQQLAAPGAPPLRSLGWGGGSDAGQVPHGFPRTRAFELLAELEVPLPRALWFLRVLALNRTRPAGWDGASEAQQRSRQFTEELLAFLESASTALPPAPTSAAAQAARRPPLPSGAAAGKQGLEQATLQTQGSTGVISRQGSMGGVQRQGSMSGMARSAAEPGSMPAQWHYGLRLAGHCCAAGLLEAAKVAEWAANSRLLLPLPFAARQQVLTLLSQCLQAAPLAQQQVLALAEQLFKSAEAAGAAAAAAATHGAGKPTGQRQQAELQELQLGLLQAAAVLLELHPAAFVSADEQLLSPLLEPPASSALGTAQQAAGDVADAQRRLARALHARVLTWHDAKAMQLLDDQLLGGHSAAEAAAALLKLVTPPSEAGAPAGGQLNGAAGTAAAASTAAPPEALADAVRLLCEWAAAAPAADFGAALLAAASGLAGPQMAGQQARDRLAAGAAALLPERVLFALAALPALSPEPAQPQQQQQQGSRAAPPLQPALFGWLSGCAAERAQPTWRRHRLLYLAVLLAEAGLLCPAAYLQGCLATAAFGPAGSDDTSGCSPSCSNAGGAGSSGGTFHLALLEQLHPLLDLPSLQDASRPSSGGAAGGGSGGGGGGSGSGGQACSQARQQYARSRAAVLAWHTAAANRQAADGSSPAADNAAHGGVTADAAAAETEWEQLCAAPGTPRSSDGSEAGQAGEGNTGSAPGQLAAQQWQEPALLQLQQQLMGVLGFVPQPSPGAEQPAPGFAALLQQVRQLPVWQQRLLAHALLAEAKAFLASTDSGGGRASRSPSPPVGAPRALASDWFLQLLAVLRACCAHREVLSLLATGLNLLQRAVAAAVRTATSGGRGTQQGDSLSEALTTAQQRWQQRSAVSPPLLLALLAAHAGSLVASDIAPKLLPMLTGGLWRLQQAAQQQAAERCLAGQRQLALDLLSLPGGPAMQLWVDKMQQEHGAGHWVVATLLQARQAASRAAGGCGGGQQLLQQEGSARLQAWVQRAQQLFARAGAAPNGTNGTGEQQQPLASLLLASAGSGGVATASALAAVQHSLEVAALPGLVQWLGSLEQQGEEQQELVQRLLQVDAPAAAALLCDPQQAYTCLHSRPNSAAPSGAAPWQLALGLFAAAAEPADDSTLSLLRRNGHDAMVAVAAAITPATARCGWLLLRLLLDERQWQGGHKLAEAERRLAACAAQQAVLRPESAAALAATLCSLSPAAAAGQQLLAEVEALLRPPVVDLAQAGQPASRQPAFGAASVAATPLPDACGPATAPSPLPFGAEQGLVDAALVCLSTGSSGERQHTFAQQLIRQLSALGDALLPQQVQQVHSAADNVWGPPAGQAHTAAAAAAAAAASPAAVQVSVWLRLSLLLPLLPLVYKHRTAADASASLRGQLLRALLRLLAVPAVRADAAQAAAEEAGSAGPTAGGPAAAAAAAAEAAGEPLPQRLLHLLRALLVGGWASWMRLEGGKLRDVPPFEHSRQLAADAAALPLPRGLQAAVQEALPLNQQQALAGVPACVGIAAPAAGGSSGSASSSLLDLDPWLVLEGGTAGSGGDGLPGGAAPAVDKAVPPWVEGAVKRRRRELRYWPTPPVTDAPLLSIAEQLQGRESEVQQAGSGSQQAR